MPRRASEATQHKFFAFCLLTAITAPSATYGQFSHPNFSSTTGLKLDGSATVVSNAIQLTVNGIGSTTSAFWHTTPVNVRTASARHSRTRSVRPGAPTVSRSSFRMTRMDRARLEPQATLWPRTVSQTAWRSHSGLTSLTRSRWIPAKWETR
jgi:hypothetical protein